MTSKPFLDAEISDEPLRDDERSAAAESFAIRIRIDELKLLRDGWLNGTGLSPNKAGLDWLSESFDRDYPVDLPTPFLFPTPEGNVLAEWSLKPWSPSLEIDLTTKRGRWHALNLVTDEERTRDVDLTKPDGWHWLAKQIRGMNGDDE